MVYFFSNVWSFICCVFQAPKPSARPHKARECLSLVIYIQKQVEVCVDLNDVYFVQYVVATQALLNYYAVIFFVTYVTVFSNKVALHLLLLAMLISKHHMINELKWKMTIKPPTFQTTVAPAQKQIPLIIT